MPIVPRSFTPSVYTYKTGDRRDTKKQKRDEHVMIAGGREGPEIVDDALRARKGKAPLRRTDRYAKDGSEIWTKELADDKTPEGTRTQSPFLRAVQPQIIGYKRGLMRVSQSLQLARDAIESATLPQPPTIEITSITDSGQLISVTGALESAEEDTLAQSSSADWVGILRRLAEEIKVAQTAVAAPSLAQRPVDFFARVYLNLKKGVSIPVRQLAVSVDGPETRAAGIARTVVSGVYTPAEDEEIISFKGAPLKPGTLITLRVGDVQYVTVDPPQYKYDEFVDTMAFARARGLRIMPYASAYGLSAGQPVIVPYSFIARLRVIYPPAASYPRVSSRSVESVESVQRDIEVVQLHINAITADLVTEVRRGKFERRRGENLPKATYTDPVTRFAFSLADLSRMGTIQPVLTWGLRPDGRFNDAVGELRGLPVTVGDLLRVLRATDQLEVLRKLRARYRNER
jgi:hypothetical protein